MGAYSLCKRPQLPFWFLLGKQKERRGNEAASPLQKMALPTITSPHRHTGGGGLTVERLFTYGQQKLAQNLACHGGGCPALVIDRTKLIDVHPDNIEPSHLADGI